jgi:hypothetical protein
MSSVEPNWWRIINSLAIWLTVFVIFVIILWSSNDSSKPVWNFAFFGWNQQVLLAFATLLLLFRYIKKIKIGSLLDIEFLYGSVNRGLESLAKLEKEDSRLSENEHLKNAKKELEAAKDTLENIKATLYS